MPAEKAGRRAVLKVVLVVLVTASITLAVVVRGYFRSIAEPNLPDAPAKNAYPDLFRAGRSIQGVVPNKGDLKTASVADLKAWVDLNREPLKAAREAIPRPSRVEVVFERDLAQTMQHVSAMRSLARLLIAQGLVEAAEGRPDQAVQTYLATVALGQSTGRGGLMLEALTGLAIERMALDRIEAITSSLTPDQLRTAIKTLLADDRYREGFDQTMDVEAVWRAKTIPPLERAALRISGAEAKLLGQSTKPALDAFKTVQSQTRKLSVSLARRLFTLNHKAEPVMDADLVPAYLDAMPVDPVTGSTMTIEVK